MENLNALLASKLYTLRRNANLKQSDLAERLNISQQAYSKLEAGVTKFNDHTIETLCRCFCISREDFLDTTKSVRSAESALFDHTGNSSAEVNQDLVLLLVMEELEKIREERKMFLEFITNQAYENKCDRDAFLSRIEQLAKAQKP